MNPTIEKMRQIKLWLIIITMLLCSSTVGARYSWEEEDFEIDGIYYSIINISTDDNNDTYYDVFIKPEHITIPENMLFLVEQSNERVAGKYHNNNTLPICE